MPFGSKVHREGNTEAIVQGNIKEVMKTKHY